MPERQTRQMSGHRSHVLFANAEPMRWVPAGLLAGVLACGLGCTRPQATAPTTPPKPTSEPLFAADEMVAATKPSKKTSAPPAPAQVGPKATVLASAIRKVTVYSDRALVTRQTTAELKTEPTVYAFRNLPGWVDDGSVRVSSSAGRIVDVQVKRTYLARTGDEAYNQVEAEVQMLQNQIAALDDELKILAAQSKQIGDIKAFSMDKLTKDTTVGEIAVSRYGEVVKFISESLRETAKARRLVMLKKAELQPEIKAKQAQLSELRSLTQLEETTVLVTLQAPKKTSAVLQLTYMLPGATWEPMHELRVSAKNPNAVELTSFAVVTQTSGEDWNNAELSFSTQSSTDTVRIPQLEALTLGDTASTTRIMETRASSFTRAQEAFEGQNLMWNKLQQKQASRHRFEEVYRTNYDYLQVVQSKTVQIFQSLQKRGTTAHFKATSDASVRGDGYSVRVRIGRSQLAAKQKIVAAPEQSLNAARTLEMVNASSQSLLPGNVALYQDGAFLGMTATDFIADGEQFALFLNVADHIKLSRVLDKRHSSVVRKKRTRMQVAFIVTVENLSDQETSLLLADRIPVSENRDIVIDRVIIKPTAKPDSKGLLSWPLTLKAKEKRQFEIKYRIEYPPTLILETQRNRARRPKKRKKRSFDLADPYEVEDQIMDLENEL